MSDPDKPPGWDWGRFVDVAFAWVWIFSAFLVAGVNAGRAGSAAFLVLGALYFFRGKR